MPIVSVTRVMHCGYNHDYPTLLCHYVAALKEIYGVNNFCRFVMTTKHDLTNLSGIWRDGGYCVALYRPK